MKEFLKMLDLTIRVDICIYLDMFQGDIIILSFVLQTNLLNNHNCNNSLL